MPRTEKKDAVKKKDNKFRAKNWQSPVASGELKLTRATKSRGLNA